MCEEERLGHVYLGGLPFWAGSLLFNLFGGLGKFVTSHSSAPICTEVVTSPQSLGQLTGLQLYEVQAGPLRMAAVSFVPKTNKVAQER